MWTLPQLLLLLLFQEAKGDFGDGVDPKEMVAVFQESISRPLEMPFDEEVENIIWSSHVRLATVMPRKERHSATVMVTNPRYQGPGRDLQLDILEDGHDTAHESSVLRTSWSSGDNIFSYTCRASNPINNTSSHFNPAGYFCAGTRIPDNPELIPLGKASASCSLLAKASHLFLLSVTLVMGLWLIRVQKRCKIPRMRKFRRNRMRLRKEEKPASSLA